METTIKFNVDTEAIHLVPQHLQPEVVERVQMALTWYWGNAEAPGDTYVPEEVEVAVRIGSTMNIDDWEMISAAAIPLDNAPRARQGDQFLKPVRYVEVLCRYDQDAWSRIYREPHHGRLAHWI